MHRALLLAVLALVLLAPTADAQTSYDGWVGGIDGDRDRSRGQGAFHALRFEVAPARRVRYRVCLSGGAADARKCWSRRTNSRGRSSINVSLFVNDQGGPGRWRAVWTVGGRRVASWRFRLTAEGV